MTEELKNEVDRLEAELARARQRLSRAEEKERKQALDTFNCSMEPKDSLHLSTIGGDLFIEVTEDRQARTVALKPVETERLIARLQHHLNSLK